MGLLARIKKFFSKDIVIDFDISSILLFPYKLKKGKIWLGSKIVVPENFEFVIAKSGKVLDTIPSGKHELKAVNLPKSVKHFKLGKIQKDGSLPMKFAADAYFLNLATFEFMKWKTYRKIECFGEMVGYYKFSADGGFAFKVKDSEIFLKELFKMFDFLRIHEAEKILTGFVSEQVISIIEKSEFDVDDFADKAKLTDKIFELLSKKFDKIGVDILGFNIENINLPKEVLEKYQTALKIEQESQIVLKPKEEKPQWIGFEMIGKKGKTVFSNNPDTFKKIQNDFEGEDKDLLINAYNKNENIRNSKNESINDLMEKQKVISNKNDGDKFVDLSLDSLYDDGKRKTIRCKFCGAENHLEDEVCVVCKEKLKGKLR